MLQLNTRFYPVPSFENSVSRRRKTKREVPEELSLKQRKTPEDLSLQQRKTPQDLSLKQRKTPQDHCLQQLVTFSVYLTDSRLMAGLYKPH
jgi:hypothetical protein